MKADKRKKETQNIKTKKSDTTICCIEVHSKIIVKIVYTVQLKIKYYIMNKNFKDQLYIIYKN
jgi:hypothetical protein